MKPVNGRTYVLQVLADAILGRPGNHREPSQLTKVYPLAIPQCPLDRLQDSFQSFLGLSLAHACLPGDGGY
jgi:hypothetical protein